MKFECLARQHQELTRRYFLRRLTAGSAAAAAAWSLLPAWVRADGDDEPLQKLIDQLSYLTPLDQFRFLGRGNPPPHKLPPEKLKEVGLTRETWQLEVTADEASGTVLEKPLTKQAGTALSFDDLMKLAQQHAVRFLHVMSCTNGKRPFGMGLWEGVPLREVVWLTRPKRKVRRLFYWGFHNNDPKQKFQGSLPIGRVLEDPPGELPVILCYKLNGQWLSPAAGGPVRLVVPGQYGNRSIKWIQNILLSNEFRPNYTYAQRDNDVESALKTCARFIHVPKTAPAGQPIPVTGLAQVGQSGLKKVQYWLSRADQKWPDDDPYFTRAPWVDADLLPAPRHWGKDVPDELVSSAVPLQLDPKTGRPVTWPLRYTIAHWAALIPAPAPGRYVLRCRTVDANGVAQPMPRPFPKSGNNRIEAVHLKVVG